MTANPKGDCARCGKPLPFLSSDTGAVEGLEDVVHLAKFPLKRELPPRGSIRIWLTFVGPTLEYAHQVGSDLCPACSLDLVHFMGERRM